MFKAFRAAFGDPSAKDRRSAALAALLDLQTPLQEAAAALLTLGQYSDAQAIAAVRRFATNSLAHPHLQQSAAEALVEIVLRDGPQDALLHGLTAEATSTLVAYLAAEDSSLKQLVREKLGL